MARFRRLATVALLCVCATSGDREAYGQHFGRNKVEYVDFDFRIFETEHFSVYYYPSEEPAARLMARLAERWYARFSRLLGHTLTTRQPLILYGSQPEFAQTNVVSGFLGEGIGGVTESAKRRIVMPFAPTLAETDHVLGHEIAHAFQFDMAGRAGALAWPLWAIEGMAQYLSLGATDAEAVMWLRDAVQTDLLPPAERDAARRFSPYRYGHAMWAYLAGRFGDDVMKRVLESRGGGFERRIRQVTGVELKQLYAEWRSDSQSHFGSAPRSPGQKTVSRRRRDNPGRLTLGPSLSPDGRQAIFFSERDRLSLDLFLADATTGIVQRKLATTSATARFESLQAIRSAGSWSADGRRFVFAAIEHGKPALVLLDMTGRERPRQIAFPQIGQVFTPSWSPDGRSIAFSALNGGMTDLYIYTLEDGQLGQLTRDPFADLQPVWSPDGRRIAFATDRFSSDPTSLSFGPCELALLDVSSGAVRELAAIEGAKHLNPQWSRSGESLFFISDPGGVNNVYRVEIASGTVHQITHVEGGVTGLAPTSPALSVARDADVLVYTSYRSGRYEMQMQRGAERLAGHRMTERPSMAAGVLPPAHRADSAAEEMLDDSDFELPDPATIRPRAYAPKLFLESIGQPYVSSGSGPFGTFVRGGGSLLFSDLLGERKLSMSAQAGNRMRDLALGVRFLNRERRWNWGAVAELEPSIRRLPRRRVDEQNGEPTLVRETHYYERIQFRMAGVLAYPLNHAQRFELDGGVRHAAYRRSMQASVLSLSTGRILDRTTATITGGDPATVGEASAAFVGDTAVFGPTSPIVGSRYRFEIASTFGDLSVTRVLLDHRRYLMPVKPYTIATRIMHVGQYGPHADDPRLVPAFLGSRQFVRGYGWSSLRCRAVEGECPALEDLLGSRVLVGNIEVRFPIMGIVSRDLRYGPLPAEGFLFADTGVVWSRSRAFTTLERDRRLVGSFGAGVRVNAFGLPLELAAMRALNTSARGWSFDFSFRPGF